MDLRTEARKKTIINFLYYGIVILIIYLCFRYVIGWFTPFIIGFLIAWLFNPLSTWLARRIRLKKSIVASVIVVLGYVILGGILTLLVIRIFGLASDLFQKLPRYFETMVAPALSRLGVLIEETIRKISPEALEQISRIQDSLWQSIQSSITSISSQGVSSITRLTARIPSFLFALIFTILSSFFLSLYYDEVTRFVMYQLPEKPRKLVLEIKNSLLNTVFKYIQAYLKIMLITCAELFLGFLIIGIPNAFGAALGIAIFDILPVFGTGGILIPWMAIQLLMGNFGLAASLAIIYAVITLVRNFIEPKIIGDQLGINPVVSLIAIYLGFRWLGLFGMILMPISVQIALTLHKNGTISLYRERDLAKEQRPK